MLAAADVAIKVASHVEAALEARAKHDYTRGSVMSPLMAQPML